MKIELSATDLRPLVEQVVAIALEQLETNNAKLGDRLAFTEPEAARLLGLPRHSLRDLRLSGQIKASKLGRRVVYSRETLLALLAKNEK